MRLVTQFKTRSLYSSLSYCQSAVLWRPFQQYNIQDVLVTSLRGVLRTSVGDAPLRQIRLHGDVLVTSAGDILKASAGDFSWRYIQDIMGHPQEVIFQRQQRTSSGCRQETSLGVTYRTIWGRPQDVFWGHLQDVLMT